jgi:lactate dehydrogenase-like 2-hydroxyacid dehydrogenase
MINKETIAGMKDGVVVVNTGHHGDNTDPSFAAAQDLDALDAQLTARGLDHEIRQPTRGRAPAVFLHALAAVPHAQRPPGR